MVTVTEAVTEPAQFVAVTVNLSGVVCATPGAVKVAVLPTTVSCTCGTSDASWAIVSVMGPVPPEAGVRVPFGPAAAEELLEVMVGVAAVHCPAHAPGGTLRGQGLSTPPRVPSAEM